MVVGSSVRFEALYRAHAGVVRAYALRRTAGGAADDVVAEVFLVAWRRLDEIPDDPVPWLLGVARRVLANMRRGASRKAALEGKLMAHHHVSALAPSVADRDDRVARCLNSLGEPDREALLLVAWDGLTLVQAARVLGVRSGTFKVRLHRARRRFAAALAAQDAGDSDPVDQARTMEALR